MSKSKGNVVSLNDISIDFGADLFRLYSVSAAELGATLDFRKKDIEAIRRRLERLYSLWDRMLPFVSNKPPAVDSPMTRWALSKFANILKKSTLYLQDLRLREYALTAFFEALNVHEHVLDRCSESEQAYVFSKTLVPWIHLLSPLIPHASEEFGEKARQEGFVSIAPWPQALQEWFNPSAESQEDFLLASVEDIQTILRLVKKKPSKITLIVSAGEKLERLKTLLKAARAEDISEDSPLGLFAKRHFYELRNRTFVDEFLVLEKSRAFLERRFGVPVLIEREAQSANPKKDKALPGKPAVYVE